MRAYLIYSFFLIFPSHAAFELESHANVLNSPITSNHGVLVGKSKVMTNVKKKERGMSWSDLRQKKFLSYPKSKASDPNVHGDFFMQPLDHLNVLDGRTWQQPYYYNDRYYKHGGPVFLYVGGEVAVNGDEIEYTFVGDLAKEHCAMGISLQHRYYEDTMNQYPSDDDLKFLTPLQATADIKYFADSISERFNLTGPWLLIGGSYGANVAAWARTKFPHNFSAVYASSGPMLANYDFPEYYEKTAEILINVSKDCANTIKSAMGAVRQILQKKDVNTIQRLFNPCGGLDVSNSNDVTMFSQNLVELIPIQNGGQENMADFCKRITNSSDKPIEIVAKLSRETYAPCMAVHTDQHYEYYKHASHYWARLWFYQTCSELGHFMSVKPTNKIFGALPISADYLQKICQNIFDFSIDVKTTKEGIRRTNIIHGGDHPAISRVLYVYGTADPWSTLKPKTIDKGAKIINVPGGGHCQDLNKPNSFKDSKSLESARKIISSTLKNWLPPTAECSS